MDISYEDLEKHLGHRISIIGSESYSSEGDRECIHIECEDCNEILGECCRDLRKDKGYKEDRGK